MYKLPKTQETEKGLQAPKCVQRLSDFSWIPFDPDNTDYQTYLKWVESGNTPEPADE